MKKIVGIDIGGTTIKAGIIDENGCLLSKSVIPTEKTAEAVIKTMGEQLQLLLKDNGLENTDIYGVGIGCPGAIDGENGIVDYANNLGWHKVKLAEGLKKYVDTTYKISNDANVATLGETVFGVAKGYKTVIMFTLGTGVGGGIVIDKKLYEGNQSKGAELGHSVIVVGGEDCTCGRKGCIEAYVSATALIRDTKRAMLKDKNSTMWALVEGDIEQVNGATAFSASKKGDKSAIKVVDNYIMYLGESILNYCNIFRPEAFVLGGGICGEGQYLIDKIDTYCKDRAYGYQGTPSVKILTASLGNDAGIIGAAALMK